MSFEDTFRFKKVIALVDGRFIFEDGQFKIAIVGSIDNLGTAPGEPCALKVYFDPRGWKYNCLCKFPPEEGDTLFVVEPKNMRSRLQEGEEIVWSNWADTKIFTVRQVFPSPILPPNWGAPENSVYAKPATEWTIVDRNYGYRPGSGSLQIVKNADGEFAIGYDAAELAEGGQPDYVVKYCDSMDECLEYARGEGYK